MDNKQKTVDGIPYAVVGTGEKAPWADLSLNCPICGYARGQRGTDDGSGVEAANLMEDHVLAKHQKTWKEFVERLSRD